MAASVAAPPRHLPEFPSPLNVPVLPYRLLWSASWAECLLSLEMVHNSVFCLSPIPWPFPSVCRGRLFRQRDWLEVGVSQSSQFSSWCSSSWAKFGLLVLSISTWYWPSVLANFFDRKEHSRDSSTLSPIWQYSPSSLTKCCVALPSCRLPAGHWMQTLRALQTFAHHFSMHFFLLK